MLDWSGVWFQEGILFRLTFETDLMALHGRVIGYTLVHEMSCISEDHSEKSISFHIILLQTPFHVL